MCKPITEGLFSFKPKVPALYDDPRPPHPQALKVSAYHYQASCETNCQIISIFLNFRIFRSPSSREWLRQHTKEDGLRTAGCSSPMQRNDTTLLQPQPAASHLTRDSASTTRLTTYSNLDVRISTIRDHPLEYHCFLHFVTCSHKSG